MGGLNMARKIAACSEFFNVRTAWHGPGHNRGEQRRLDGSVQRP